MPTSVIARPAVNEYAPYYGRYIDLVPDDGVLELLDKQHDVTMALLRGIKGDKAGYRYAADKWSIREVVSHVIDAERIFCYRALRFARGDTTPLPGFEQDDYVKTSNAEHRSMFDLASELHHVRQATLLFFRGLDEQGLASRGVASGVEISVRALAYVIAGHERHHVEVLKARYLNT